MRRLITSVGQSEKSFRQADGLFSGAHNLILNTRENWKQFQSRLSLGERRHEKKKNQLIDGPQPSRPDVAGPNDKVPNIKAWAVGPNFCVDCGKQKPPHRQSIQMFTESMPHLDMTPLDVAFYTVCKGCFEDEQLGAQIECLDEDGDETDTRQARREKHIIEWIAAARLRGQSPAQFDGTGRRMDKEA